jgi:hypothetical protein
MELTFTLTRAITVSMNGAAKTKHAADCSRAFANLDMDCPRCRELAAGAPARKGWGSWKREMEAQQLRAIRTHNCASAGCGPVCTYGDW